MLSYKCEANVSRTENASKQIEANMYKYMICVNCQDTCADGLRVPRCSRPDNATP